MLQEYKRIANESRPDEAFVTDRAVKTGRANAASGRIMVTTPNDHFGPIGPGFDPSRNRVSNKEEVLGKSRGKGFCFRAAWCLLHVMPITQVGLEI